MEWPASQTVPSAVPQGKCSVESHSGNYVSGHRSDITSAHRVLIVVNHMVTMTQRDYEMQYHYGPKRQRPRIFG